MPVAAPDFFMVDHWCPHSRIRVRAALRDAEASSVTIASLLASRSLLPFPRSRAGSAGPVVAAGALLGLGAALPGAEFPDAVPPGGDEGAAARAGHDAIRFNATDPVTAAVRRRHARFMVSLWKRCHHASYGSAHADAPARALGNNEDGESLTVPLAAWRAATGSNRHQCRISRPATPAGPIRL